MIEVARQYCLFRLRKFNMSIEVETSEAAPVGGRREHVQVAAVGVNHDRAAAEEALQREAPEQRFPMARHTPLRDTVQHDPRGVLSPLDRASR